MKKYIISQIAKQYRKHVAVAKNLKVKHIAYMYQYSYFRLLKTYWKSFQISKCKTES